MSNDNSSGGSSNSSLPHYSFELEFMVAREKTGYEYEESSSDSEDEEYTGQIRWACDADIAHPVRACLDECADIFIKNDEPVAVRYDSAAGLGGVRRFLASNAVGSQRFAYWYLEPSKTAVPRDGCPSNYDWIGVRLRSPFFPRSELTSPESTVKWYLGTLRKYIRLHVNSTCKYNVQVRPGDRIVDLVMAKKLATLTLLLEPNMLRHLCPDSDHSGRKHSLEDVVYRKMVPFPGLEQTRPVEPGLARTMDEHVPGLRDPELQQMRENGRPAAFALCLYEAPADPPTVEFRYGLWHPYGSADVSYYWCHLACQFISVADIKPAKFKTLVAVIDSIIHGFDAGVAENEQWKILLDVIGLDETWSVKWNKIIALYKRNGLLDRRNLDRHGFLPPIVDLERPYRPS